MADSGKLKAILAEYVTYCQSCSDLPANVQHEWLQGWFARLNAEPPPVGFVREKKDWNAKYEKEYSGPDVDIVDDVLRMLSVTEPAAKQATALRGKGEAQPIIEEAFVLHHRYEAGSIGNFEPLTIRELSVLAGGVSTSTVHAFFSHWFPDGGINDYKIDLKRDSLKTRIVLRQISKESVVGMMRNYGSDPNKLRQ